MTYRCTVCGHIVEMDGEMPSSYTCPMCGVGADQFEEV